MAGRWRENTRHTATTQRRVAGDAARPGSDGPLRRRHAAAALAAGATLLLTLFLAAPAHRPGLAAPVGTVHGPVAPARPAQAGNAIPLPIILSAPVVDGSCTDPAYGSAIARSFGLLPNYPTRLVSVYLVRTSTDLYACLARMPRDTGTFAALYVDPDNSGDALAQDSDTMVSVFLPGVNPGVTTRRGDGAGSYTDFSAPPGAITGSRAHRDEFLWDAELRISLSFLGGADHALGLAAAEMWVQGAPGNDKLWPPGAIWNAPVGWQDLSLATGMAVGAAVADSYVVRVDNGGDPNPHGDAPILAAGSRSMGDFYLTFRGLARFDLPTLPPGVSLRSVTLNLFVDSADSPDGTLNLEACRAATAWNEALVTWDNQPASVGTCASAEVGPVAGGWQQWDVTIPGRAWYFGSLNAGLRIRRPNDETGAQNRRNFASREATDPSLRPRLEIAFALATPTPTSTRTNTPTGTPSRTPTPTPTATSTGTGTNTATATSTATATGSNTATGTATATATLTPTSRRPASVRGRVLLERRPVSAGASLRLADETAVSAADGSFSFAAVPEGAWTLRLSHASYLAASLAVTVTAGEDLVLPPVGLLAGDVDQSGAIDRADVDAVAGAHGATAADGRWRAAFDITDDGVVDVLDLVAVLHNLGRPRPSDPRPTPEPTPAPLPGRVSWCAGPNGAGPCASRPVGRYSDPYAMGVAGRTVSSLVLGEGVAAILCSQPNFQGRCAARQPGASDLTQLGEALGDLAMSAIVAPLGCQPGPRQVALFWDRNLAGPCTVLDVGTYGDAASIGLPGDTVSSVSVGEGVVATLCADAGLRGACSSLGRGEDENLADDLLGEDSLSSLAISAPDCMARSGEIAVFDETGFGGRCAKRGIGEYLHGDELGLPGDHIQSIVVGTAVEAVLCEHASWNGRCTTFAPGAAVADLDTANVGAGRASSGLVRPWDWRVFDLGQSVYVGRKSAAEDRVDDKDLDGLDDDLEALLADHFRPLHRFDKEEKWRQAVPEEPVTLFQVRPVGCVGPDCTGGGFQTQLLLPPAKRMFIRYVFLLQQDGGYQDSFCFDDHPGDNDSGTLLLASFDNGRTWRIEAGALGSPNDRPMSSGGKQHWPQFSGSGDFVEASGSHVVAYNSAGKHHLYLHAGDWDDAPYSRHDCHDDNDGDGVTVLPGLQTISAGDWNNVGEPEAHPWPWFVDAFPEGMFPKCGTGLAAWSEVKFCGGGSAMKDKWLSVPFRYTP